MTLLALLEELTHLFWFNIKPFLKLILMQIISLQFSSVYFFHSFFSSNNWINKTLDSKVRLYLKLNLSTHISVHTVLKKKVGLVTIATRRTASFLNTKMLRCWDNVCLLTFSLFLRPRNNFPLNDWGSSNQQHMADGGNVIK